MAMSHSLSSRPFTQFSQFGLSLKSELGPLNLRPLSFCINAKGSPKSRNAERNRRQVWRRRKLTKKDEFMEAKLERVPFLEEQVRKLNEGGGLLAGDIDRLMKSEDNRFKFVNDIAAEATSYVEKNRDEYGAKKAILHVISNRMNEAGFARPEAYMETDPYLPGPDYLKRELY